jgi:hypothetical protein
MSFNQIKQYSQPANAQALATQQTLAAQQKQAAMFSGGSIQAPDMGGNNPATQTLANGIAEQMARQQSQAANDARAVKGGGTGKYRTRRRKKKHTKRKSKRKQYKRR